MNRANPLRNLLLMLFKRKRIILSVFTVVLAGAVIVSFTIPPVYEASAKLILEREGDTEKSLLFKMNFPNPTENYDWIKSELEIIRSFPVAQKVVKDLALVPGHTDDAISVAESRLYRAARDFQRDLEVSNPTNSNVVEIFYNGKDPKQIAAIVNKVVHVYKAYRADLYNESDTYKFFENQIRLTDEKLHSLEKSLTAYKFDKQIISPSTQGQILLSKLSEYESRLTEVNTKRIGKQAKLNVIKRQLRRGIDISIPSTEVSEGPSREKYIAKLKSDLLDKEVQRENLLQRFSPKYERVVNLEREIASIKKQIKDEIHQIIEQEETALQALRAEERALAKSIDQINEEIREFTKKEFQFSQLNRGIDDSREVYSMLLKQREEARISQAKLQTGVKIKVVSPAVAPLDPAVPNKKMLISLAAFFGLFLALGLAFGLEYFDHSINTPEQLQTDIGLNVLGSIKEYSNMTQYCK